MKAIVTGGAGFIGSHLVERLVNEGWEVIVIDNLSAGDLKNLESVKGKYHLLMRDIGVLDGFSWEENLFENVDVVFHLAALARMQRSIDDPIETHISNVNGTLNMLEFARKIKAKKFIYASSSSVYGDQEHLPVEIGLNPNPQNPYATQKYIGELYCDIYNKVFGVQTLSLRFFNVYGPRMNLKGQYKLVFGNWINQIKEGKPIEIFGDGNQTRDFTYISDVVDALIKGVGYSGRHIALNVCSGKETSVNVLAGMFSKDRVHLEARAGEEKRKFGSWFFTNTFLEWHPKIFIDEGIAKMKEYYGL